MHHYFYINMLSKYIENKFEILAILYNWTTTDRVEKRFSLTDRPKRLEKNSSPMIFRLKFSSSAVSLGFLSLRKVVACFSPSESCLHRMVTVLWRWWRRPPWLACLPPRSRKCHIYIYIMVEVQNDFYEPSWGRPHCSRTLWQASLWVLSSNLASPFLHCAAIFISSSVLVRSLLRSSSARSVDILSSAEKAVSQYCIPNMSIHQPLHRSE